MNKKYNIICFSNIDWSFIYQRHQHMMSAFAQKNLIDKIIYVETLGSRKIKLNKEDMLRIYKKLVSLTLKILRRKKEENKSVEGNIGVLSPIAIPIMKDFFYWVNEWMLSFQLNRYMKQLKMEEKNTIAWVNLSHPSIFNLVRKRKFHEVVYDCIDDIKSFPNMSPDIVQCEVEFIKYADIVFATSNILFQHCKQHNDFVFMLPNAVSNSWIEKKQSTIKPIARKKTVGYVGAIYEWFDLEILYECVVKFTDVEFFIVGPVRVDISKFQELEHIHFIGKVSYEEVEKFVDSFDVCLIPFKINNLTLNTNPVKVYEYFAKGKPVVSTHLPELEQFNEILYLAEDSQEYIRQLERALFEDHTELKQKRIEIARENTWENRVDMVLKVIEQIS